jgi:hypothetical protein
MDVANSEFILFLNCAKANHLRYMVIGGYAVNYFGYHRHTDDLDLWMHLLKPTKQLKLIDCMVWVIHRVKPKILLKRTLPSISNVGSTTR